VSSYPGFSSQPFTWDEVGAKFDNLVGPRADEGLRRDIKSAVRSLESIQVSELMELLAKVRTS
jgi:2-methylcitrate dehydratase PrpD